MAETNLRQADAKVNVVGVLSDMELTEQKDDTGATFVGGYLTVKTSDVNFVRFNVRVNEKKKDGTPNSTYTGIQTVMNEYEPVSKVGEESATRLRVNGDINLYTNRQGNSSVGYKSNFFNRYQGTNEEFEEDKKAEFEVEVFIAGIAPEMVNGEETDRLIVKGWVPTYNGIEPIVLVAADKEIADGIDSTFDVGQTVKFYGDVINSRVAIRKEVQVAIGKPRIEVSYEGKNELVITGATPAYEEDIEGPNAAYSAEAIKGAINERNARIEEMKNNTQPAPKTSTPSAAAQGRSSKALSF